DSVITITCGSISIENTGKFNFGSNSVKCGDLQNKGTLSFTGNLDVKNDATFTGDFTNEGTINVSKNANFDASLTNDGTITCEAGDFTVTEFYSGTGTLTLPSGKSTFRGNVTNNGEIVGGTGELLVNGNYSGSGKLTLSSATSTFKGGTVDFSDVTLNHNNGTIIFAKEPSGSYGQVALTVNNTVFNNVQIGTNDKTVKIDVTGNFTVAGDFSASNPKNIISQQQTSSYKGITFSGTGKTISFLGKNTIEQIQVTGGSNTISFASEHTIKNLSVTANGNEITFSAENSIGTLNLNGELITAKFGAEKIQTISNLTATGTSGNEVLLTTDSASPSVNDNSTWWNVAGLTSGNVTISNAKIEYSKSHNPLLLTSPDVTENPEASTENWFLRKFYWFGKTDTKWDTAFNWSSSGDSYVACPIAPPSDSGLSEITIVKNDTNILLLDNDIKVKSFDVNVGTFVDFASYNVTSANGISNEGTIRLQGTSGQTFAAHTNKDDSTIEYYGNNFASFAWGTDYENLIFSEGISGDFVSFELNVLKNTTISNGTGNDISLKGTFTGNVILINAGSVTLTSSAQINVSGNCSNLSIDGNLVVNNALSSSGIISVTGTTSATGVISASGDITFGKNAIINEVTSTNGAISVSGATSANGNITSAQSQTFNGAFTLQSDVVLSAGTNTITFKGTVNGTHALTIGNNANTTNVTFEKSVGSVNKLASLDVKGNATATAAVST
ncbi:MAG: hypothetical protein IIW71_10510, partial [Treponema sp.]|nr:hypothetical protein [Treponema sp.]